MRIEGVNNGKGGVNEVSVDKEGRLQNRTVSQNDTSHAVDEGRAFQSYTAKINFGDATKQIALYLKNNEENNIFITSATIGTSVSTGASDNIILLEQVGNIQPGDAIVSATDVVTTNRNTGEAAQFEGDVKKGPSTPSGNEVAVNGTLGDFTTSRTFDLTAEVSKGGSLGIAITPPLLNTNMDVTITIAFHIKENV